MSNKQAVQKLISILWSYRKTIFIIILYLLISTTLNFCLPLISKVIMDDGFIGGNKDVIIKMVILSLIIYFISSFIDVKKEKSRVDISAKIRYSLCEESFQHLMKLKISYFNNMNHAEILNNINIDIENIACIADDSLFFVITKVFGMIGGAAGLFIIDYRLAVLVLMFIPLKYLVMKYFAKMNAVIMNEFIEKNEVYARWFGDCIGGVKEVKLFNLYKNKHDEFKKRQRDVIDYTKRMNMLEQYNIICDNIMVQILGAFIYIAGAYLVYKMQLSVGSIFAFITYSTYVTDPISAILNIGYLLSGIIPSTKRYYEFLNLEEEDDKGDEKAILGDIEIKDVSFSYDENYHILKNINCYIERGSKTALIGKNGSGKSTLINLITRLYEPSKGVINLDGRNIDNISLNEYRNCISIVSQQIYLFNDSIRNNICLYKDIDDEKIMKACIESNLGEFVKNVSLDYIVGENGVMLSGGQKQKIALARAIIHDKPIVILDEATSNSDIYSEMQINKLIETRLKDKTVIIVSHKTDILKKQIIL